MTAATKILLVPLEPTLLTSYGPGGATRDARGRPFAEAALKPVGRTKWVGSRALARDVVLLDAAWHKKTGRRVRLTEVDRPYEIQAAARDAYERWVKAGKPGPKDRGFDAATMKAAYVAAPNGSNHGWAGAIDIDVEATCIDNDGLSDFWDVAGEFGFRPIITAPHIGQSEAWHFDHLGPLEKVHRLFLADKATRGNAYKLTAEVGCILAGTYGGPGDAMARYVQARALLAGIYVGPADGHLGRQTITALEKAQIPGLTASAIVTAMNERGTALAELEDL